MKRITTCFLLAAILIAVPIMAQDQDEKTITDIVIEGNSRVPTEMILTYISQSPGQTVNEQLLKTDFQALWNTDLFSNIRIIKRPNAEGGITLVVVVEELPKIREIRFEGLDVLSEGTIEDKMVEPPNDLVIEPGSVLSFSKLSTLQRIIYDLLKERGLEFSEVRYRLEQVNDIETDVVFMVNEGGIVKIQEVRFVGNESFSQWTLGRVMTKSRPTWALSWVTKDDTYSSQLLDEDLERLREFYAENGFLRVSIQEPIVETVEDDPLLGGRDMRAIITIHINEGRQYQINDIAFKDNDLVTDDELTQIFELKPGDMYNRKAIQNSLETIGKIYKNQGYIQFIANENIEYVQGKPGYINLIVEFKEDDAYFVNTIDFVGNRTTRDKVMRRNIYLFEGSPFSLTSFEDSMRRLNQLGFFGSIDQQIDPNTEPAAKRRVDDLRRTALFLGCHVLSLLLLLSLFIGHPREVAVVKSAVEVYRDDR